MKKFDRIEQIQPAAPEPSREPVDVEALARTLRKHIVERHVTMPFEDDPKFGKVISGSDWKAWDEATDARTVEILAALRRVQPEKETP